MKREQIEQHMRKQKLAQPEKHGDGGWRIAIFNVARLFVMPPPEAKALAVRLREVFIANTSPEERAMMDKFNFTPSLFTPVSASLTLPEGFKDHALDIGKQLVSEAYPGAKVVDGWVFDQHNVLGVSVVIDRLDPKCTKSKRKSP